MKIDISFHEFAFAISKQLMLTFVTILRSFAGYGAVIVPAHMMANNPVLAGLPHWRGQIPQYKDG